MAGNVKTGQEQERVDNNRTKKIETLRRFEHLWAALTDPSFDGTLKIEISAKAGRVSRPGMGLFGYEGEP